MIKLPIKNPKKKFFKQNNPNVFKQNNLKRSCYIVFAYMQYLIALLYKII
jgi:hypothetical protein